MITLGNGDKNKMQSRQTTFLPETIPQTCKPTKIRIARKEVKQSREVLA